MTSIKTASITFPANGVDGTGYLAQPDDGAAHPGVVVIQEWWGLDGHIRDVAERFAREGFVALAPDLYHGQVATEPDEARKLVMAMNRERAIEDCVGAVRCLQGLVEVAPKRVGCAGFCMGGSMTLALAAATPDVAAAAPFWGGLPPPAVYRGGMVAFLFGVSGAEDQGIPLDRVRAFEETLKSTGRNAVVKVYDGAPHSFFNDTKASYRPEAARDAWERTLALFRRALT